MRPATPKGHHQLRIIGGEWRSRRLPFAAVSGVRPTPDRIRETLFNWLQGDIEGARCLDLFSGSGALGFEALSRGAQHVTMVDEDIRVIQQLQKNADALHTDRLTLIWQDALSSIAELTEVYNIVFLDPPYRDDVLEQYCRLLAERHLVSSDGLVYLECASHRPPPALPAGWHIHKEKKAGKVRYALIRIADT